MELADSLDGMSLNLHNFFSIDTHQAQAWELEINHFDATENPARLRIGSDRTFSIYPFSLRKRQWRRRKNHLDFHHSHNGDGARQYDHPIRSHGESV